MTELILLALGLLAFGGDDKPAAPLPQVEIRGAAGAQEITIPRPRELFDAGVSLAKSMGFTDASNAADVIKALAPPFGATAIASVRINGKAGTFMQRTWPDALERLAPLTWAEFQTMATRWLDEHAAAAPAPSPMRPPADDDDGPAVSDDVALPGGCVWQISGDGASAFLCGASGNWRAVFDNGDEGRKYALPEHAITRIVGRLQLASAREIEIIGHGFHASVGRRAGKYEWKLHDASGNDGAGAATLLDAIGEVWQRTGSP